MPEITRPTVKHVHSKQSKYPRYLETRQWMVFYLLENRCNLLVLWTFWVV